MLLVKFVYDLNFGQKHNSSRQRLHNEDNDRGVLKGEK
jgi:hypothetical protein